MIKILITRKSNNTELIIQGHSGYDVIGKDIVCSAVSTSVLTTINLLDKMSIIHSFSSDDSLPKMHIVVNDDNYGLIIINNLIDTLKSIADQYPKYVNVTKKI